MHLANILETDQLDLPPASVRQAAEQFADVLAKSDLFNAVPEAFLADILRKEGTLELQDGQILLSPEKESHHVYVVLSGALGVHFGSINSPEIRVLEKGSCVGEMSIIDQSKPSAYIVAKGAAKVFPVHKDILLQYVSDVNPIVGNLLKILTRWIRENTESMLYNTSKIGELTNHASTDALTGLFNRRWLDGSLSHILAEAIETCQPLCLLLLDVDHFKSYNDSFGHSAGDNALKIISNTIKSAIRPEDFACRYGGEEFLVLLPKTTMDEGVRVAERIRHAVEGMSINASNVGDEPKLTISVGLGVSNSCSTPKALIDLADTKLYQAKQEGRNCVRY